jgi:diguanylate cyclase (GGDEF)-like protein/PAS domain S-box-containing protein
MLRTNWPHPHPLPRGTLHPLLERLVERHFGPAGAPGPECAALLRSLDAELAALDTDAEAVRASHLQFRELAETIAAATFIYQGSVFRYVNAAAVELTGYSREELVGMEFWAMVHPDHRDRVRERGLARQRGEEVPERYPFKILRRDGEERWVDFTAGRIEYQGEWAALGTAFDITERKRAEEALARQALAFENLYDAVVITDPAGRITDWNPAAERIYGWSREEVLGETVDLWLPPSDAADLNRRILDALEEEGRWTGTVRFVRKDGRLGLSETVVLPLKDALGTRVGALGVSRDVTEREHAAEALRVSEERYRLMVAGSEQVFFYVHNVAGVYESLSPSVMDVLGYAPEELVGKRYGTLHPREGWDPTGVDEQTAITLASGGAPHSYRVVARHRDGHPVALELVETTVRRDGEVRGVQGFARDITARTRAEEALRESEERYRTLFEESRDAVYITTLDGRFVAVNQALVEQFGYTREELLAGNVADLYTDAQDRARFRDEIFRDGYVRDFEVRLARRDGVALHCLVSATLRRGPDGVVRGFQGIIHDFTERKRAEERLAYGALHDALTGLPNRALFMDRLERAAERDAASLAVFFVDLDRFKVVNDSMGHVVGDRMLVEIARRLAAAMPPGATVARFGGDEFTVLLHPARSALDATHMAERLLDSLAVPFALAPGQEVFASASIGIALGTGASETPEDLLRNADAALSRAKARGKNRYEVFDRAMHAEAVDRLQMETDLRRALERGELRLLFQPIVALEEGRLAGFEALLRWDHPERGTITPDLFIPLAEETGLISPVGRWVLEEGCRHLAAWDRLAPGARPFLSINLSARQFGDADLADHVARTVAGCAVDPARVWLEITETVILENAEHVRTTLRRLKELGVQLCMDDFGTGYSSLGYLHRMELDELKIDRSFVSRMEHDPRSAQLVHAIVALAHNLGVRVVAEGVETRAQLDSLRELRCDYAQGFLFAPGLPPDAADALLAEDRRW